MKKLIFKNTLLYSIPDIITKLLPFITLPIVTRYLTIDEIGLIGIYGIVIALYSLFSQFGVAYVINSQWFKLSIKNREVLLYNLFLIGIILSFLAIILFLIIKNLITPLAIGDNWDNLKNLTPFILIQVFFAGVKSLFDSFMIITRNVILVLKLSIFTVVINTTLFLYMVIITSDIFYILGTQALIASFIGIIYSYIILKNCRFKFNKYFWYKTFFISYPIYIRSLFNFIRNRYDKMYIANILGSANFAIYNFAFSVSSILSLLGSAFDKSYSPLLIENISKNEKDNSALSFMIFLYFVIMVTILIIFFFLGKPLINLISNSLFRESYDYILLLFLNPLISSFALSSGNILIYYEKTKFILFTTVVQALITISFIVLFVPILGAKFAIISILIGTLYYSTHQYMVSKKLFQIELKENILIIYSFLFSLIIFDKVYFHFINFNLLSCLFIILYTFILCHLYYRYLRKY
ncbi:MAG: hypothetical protein CL623_00370 [Arcobacter sp.]|nr:hypothetical protein [Arcobacter sp.]|tara:strand:+ start:15891 stop:17291 length:1401 start_codon:yes stop_codon:yes gene_type:complete